MTRWNILGDLVLSRDARRAIGKAWPLFFFLIFKTNQSNKFVTSYPELQEQLNESANTIKKWKSYLVEHNVMDAIVGRTSMTFRVLKPYDSLVTCEQDDVTKVKMTSDPATRRMLDKLSKYDNMSLLPVVAELASKLDNLEKRLA